MLFPRLDASVDRQKKRVRRDERRALFVLVRLKGLEPPRREASDPKSDVATNYTTAALESCRESNGFFVNPQTFGLLFRR